MGYLFLQGNLAENWKIWIQKIDLFLKANRIAAKSRKCNVPFFFAIFLKMPRLWTSINLCNKKNHFAKNVQNLHVSKLKKFIYTVI